MKVRTGWRAVARYLSGQSSSREAVQVEEWASADPKHAELLETAGRAWEVAQTEPPRLSVDAAWRSVAERLEPAERALPARWRRPPMWAWSMAAAAVLALIAVPLVRFQLPPRVEGQLYATGPNEQLMVRFDDGSVARLAPNSRLRAAPNGAREAWLEGTAFFGVAERNGEPFIVHTAAGDARVLGTRFELREQDGHVRLAVLEGRVQLIGSRGEELVTAGNVSQTSKRAAPSPPRSTNVHELLGWMGDVLIFQDTPLGEAALEIQRKYGIPVRLSDDALSERTLTAVFDRQNLETVVNTVCRVVDARCQVHDSRVVVRP